MYRYKSLLVILHDDTQDDRLIDHAAMVAHLARAGRVQFLHVMPEIPALSDRHPDVSPFLHEASAARHAALARRVAAAHFAGPWHTTVHVDVTDGPPLAEVQRVAQEGAFDLLLVGQSELAEHLTRRAPCSVLVVPDGAPAHVERVVVPVDFSAHAAEAVDVALAFAQASGIEAVHLLHTHVAPTAYSARSDARAEVTREEAHRWAAQRFAAFLDRLDLRGLVVETHLVETASVAEATLAEIDALGADLVVVGTRGRSPSAAIQLGRVAEAVLKGAHVPVLAVKHRSTATNLLDRLLAQHVARAAPRLRPSMPA
ncbi:MAG: universal stress protein [Bacteroidota bacterium]